MKRAQVRAGVVLLLASVGFAACAPSPFEGEACPKSIALAKDVFSVQESLIGWVVVSNQGQDPAVTSFSIDLYDLRDGVLIDAVEIMATIPATGEDHQIEWRLDTPDREGEYQIVIHSSSQHCVAEFKVAFR